MRYFDHDSMAGDDDKIVALRLEHGGAAVDAYWVILERIYRDETALDYFDNRHAKRTLCHCLNADVETLDSWVSTMLELTLFTLDAENPKALVSERAMSNIRAYQGKCETARQNGKKGGRKPSVKPTGNQDANQTQSERQAKKRKEKKDIGSHKENQISSSAVAAEAAKAAPPAEKKAICPMCEVETWKDSLGYYHCPNCHDQFTKDKVGWR